MSGAPALLTEPTRADVLAALEALLEHLERLYGTLTTDIERNS